MPGIQPADACGEAAVMRISQGLSVLRACLGSWLPALWVRLGHGGVGAAYRLVGGALTPLRWEPQKLEVQLTWPLTCVVK